MIKQLLLSFCAIIYVTNLRAQNLIPNASFESFSLCPNGVGQIYKCSDWFSTAASLPFGSPDYYNSCTVIDVGVPNNFNGFQLARTGNAYAGIVTYIDGLEFREYISVQLTNPLIADTNYYLEMYISLADASVYNTNSVGVYFSKTIINNEASHAPLTFIPQITAEGYHFNTDDWVKVTGTYKATGEENYIIIGNFNTDENTSIIDLENGSSEFKSYLLIDDVSLFQCPTISVLTEVVNETNNLANGSITITASGGAGNYKYSLDNINFQTNNVFTGLTSGNYTVYVKDENACPSTTNVNLNGTLSIKNNSITNIVSVFPNPFQKEIHIKSKLINTKQVRIKMYDILGKQVFQTDVNNYQNEIIISPEINKGIYFFKLTIDGSSEVLKLIKT